MNYHIVTGQRLTFRNCKLLKRTAYKARFRDTDKVIYRHLFSSDLGMVIYSGAWIEGLLIGQTRDIRGTVKRIENFAGGTVRISRPKIIAQKR